MTQARRPTAADIPVLLAETVQRMVHGDAQVLGVTSDTITRGVSGAEVRRHAVTVRVPDGPDTTVSLVTKMSDRVERLTLAHLNAQGHPGVPFSHARDVGLDGPDWICLQDLGDDGRPDVLSPLPDETLASEVTALASIHAANAGDDGLSWLPRADREYARSMIDEVAGLDGEDATRTLVHTEINPGNVLVRDGQAFLIDWADAHRGSLYLDVPHHLYTPELAERYRQALDRSGLSIDRASFAERYRVAARYTALRTMWWSFEAWREDRDAAGWVLHYFGMLDL